MDTLMGLKIPSVIKTNDHTASMRINSEWELKITISEDNILYEAQHKGKNSAIAPSDVIGVIDVFKEKYTDALKELLESGLAEPEIKDPIDNLKAGGFEIEGEAPEVLAKESLIESPKDEDPVKQNNAEDAEMKAMEANVSPKHNEWKQPPKKHTTRMANEIQDAEWVQVCPEDLPTLPAPVGISGIVRPAVSAAEALAAWREFQDLKRYILEPSDILKIQGKNFIVKSGWRKFATFYNLTDRIVEENQVPLEKGFYWKIKVVCTAPNGRETEGVGMCALSEKNGARALHDCYTTAHTRAKNRAISDMIAAGEVSAEEMV